MALFHNLLLVQSGDIGDVILTTPTIRAAKENSPAARVSILVRAPFGSLLRADPHLHQVLEIEKGGGGIFAALGRQGQFLWRLRRAGYDLAVDLRTGDRGAILSWCSGARERVGRPAGGGKWHWHNLLFTKIVDDTILGPPGVHPGADQSLRIVRPLGIDSGDSRPRIYLAPGDAGAAARLLAEHGVGPADRFLTLNPCSRWHYKEWELGKWGLVLDRLWEEYRLPALLIGSREERAALQPLVAGRAERTYNLAGTGTLGELAALLARSTLHLGVDSAAPHLAAAVGTPTLAIHGPTDWRAWRVVGEKERVVVPPLPCVPCRRMGCEDRGESLCLRQLEGETVVRAAAELLR